jgi:hypothetical protein
MAGFVGFEKDGTGREENERRTTDRRRESGYGQKM